MQCPAGQEPNHDKSGCLRCSEGYFNPTEGGYCKKCPEFTYSTSTTCEAFDQIVFKDGTQHMHYLSKPSQICSQNKYLCEGKLLGPVKNKTQASDTSDLIFYFSNRDELKTDRYDFHESKLSDEVHLNKSYIYLLYNIKNAPVGQL